MSFEVIIRSLLQNHLMTHDLFNNISPEKLAMETSPASPVNQTSLTSATKGENFSRKKSNRHSFRSEEDCNNECKWQHTGLGLDYQVDISFDQLTLIWTALRKTKVVKYPP